MRKEWLVKHMYVIFIIFRLILFLLQNIHHHDVESSLLANGSTSHFVDFPYTWSWKSSTWPGLKICSIYKKKLILYIHVILRITKAYQILKFILTIAEIVKKILMKLIKMNMFMTNEKVIFYYPYMVYHTSLSTNENVN